MKQQGKQDKLDIELFNYPKQPADPQQPADQQQMRDDQQKAQAQIMIPDLGVDDQNKTTGNLNVDDDDDDKKAKKNKYYGGLQYAVYGVVLVAAAFVTGGLIPFVLLASIMFGISKFHSSNKKTIMKGLEAKQIQKVNQDQREKIKELKKQNETNNKTIKDLQDEINNLKNPQQNQPQNPLQNPQQRKCSNKCVKC